MLLLRTHDEQARIDALQAALQAELGRLDLEVECLEENWKSPSPLKCQVPNASTRAPSEVMKARSQNQSVTVEDGYQGLKALIIAMALAMALAMY